jgi:hypothetical protein
MRPSCKRCHGYLLKRDELTEGYRMDFISCSACGWRIYRSEVHKSQKVVISRERQIAEAGFKKLTAESKAPSQPHTPKQSKLPAWMLSDQFQQIRDEVAALRKEGIIIR